MMAPDSNPTPPPALAEETVERVRRALIDYLDAPERAGPPLRAALHAMAAEARAKSLLPEQLLVALKELWQGLPVATAGSASSRAGMLQRVVTMCIKEYYSV